MNNMDVKNDKLKGSFVGLAIGDALGVPLEFHLRDEMGHVQDMIGKGPFNLNPGEWTDDTSMALCIADSLIHQHNFDATDIMQNFVKWWQTGFMSHNGRCFDIGRTTQVALENFLKTGDPYAGSGNEFSAGNGSIMRLSPIPIFFNENKEECIHFSVQQSKLTHNAPQCIDIVTKMSSLLFDLYDDKLWHDLVDVNSYLSKNRMDVKSTGYVVDTYDAALWAICNTQTFEDALILAVNLADDSDTVGAVTGQLAGAKYGYGGIPDRWLSKLVWKDKIEVMFDELIVASKTPSLIN